MLISFRAKGEIRSKAEINCELIFPGSSVESPLRVPPSMVTGGVVFPSQEAFIPSFFIASTSDFTGRLEREGPPTSRCLPGISEQIAIINLRVVADSPQ